MLELFPCKRGSMQVAVTTISNASNYNGKFNTASPAAGIETDNHARMHATDNNGEDFAEPLRSSLIDESVPRGVGVALRDVVVVLLSRRAPNHQHYH